VKDAGKPWDDENGGENNREGNRNIEAVGKHRKDRPPGWCR